MKMLKSIQIIMKFKLSFLSFAFCLLALPSVSAQQWKLFKKNDSLDCRYFLTDHLKNIYIITHRNELLKYDGDGYFDSRFSFKKFGKIGSVRSEERRVGKECA